MEKFILYQYIWVETDWRIIYDVLKIFAADEYRDIFLWGCTEVLKAKILLGEGKKVRVTPNLEFVEE